jgi:DNA polymerase-3 subunit delta'
MTILVGHERAIRILDRTVDEGRPAHAYLFTGRDGIGKKLVAIRFACRLNCPDVDADPDGTCRVCSRIAAGNHPDFTLEVPERRIIRIDRIRDLQSFFRYAPIEGKYKVTVIDDAHSMNHAAQNALLKTLEEPPPGRIVILITARPSRLLPTVRSRCRRIRFGPLPIDSLAGLLERDQGMSPQKAKSLASMSGGSVSRALEMDSSHFPELQQQVLSLLADPSGHGISGIVETSASISSDRKRATDAMEIAVTWIRDRLVENVGGNAFALIHGDSLDRISSTAHHLTGVELLSVYDELIKAGRLIEADINVNPTLVTDVLLLRMARILAGPTYGVSRSDR